MDRGGAIASLWLLPACLPLLAAVSAWDIRWRLIPDWACIGLAVLGLGAAAASGKFFPHILAGLALAALGAFASWRGFWGWGDAKLIAACGCVCGPQLVLPFLFFTSLAGAAIATVTLVMRPIARTWARRPSERWPRWVRVELTRLRRAPSTPYGVALAAGLVLAFTTPVIG